MLQWGNVHLSMARKFLDDAAMKGTFKDLESRIKSEFDSAASKYKEALGIKTDFYDGEMQLGQVDFERAKLAAGFLPEPVRCTTVSPPPRPLPAPTNMPGWHHNKSCGEDIVLELGTQSGQCSGCSHFHRFMCRKALCLKFPRICLASIQIS